MLAAGHGRTVAPPPGLLDDGAPGLDDELLLGGGIQSPRRQRGPPPLQAPLGAPSSARRSKPTCGHGVDTLVFAGCNFPNCPRTSVYEASERDFRIALVDDAVSGLYDRAVDKLRGIGVTLALTDDLVRALGDCVTAP